MGERRGKDSPVPTVKSSHSGREASCSIASRGPLVREPKLIETEYTSSALSAEPASVRGICVLVAPSRKGRFSERSTAEACCAPWLIDACRATGIEEHGFGILCQVCARVALVVQIVCSSSMFVRAKTI
eukprot:3392182-Amphidinium_carterae.1